MSIVDGKRRRPSACDAGTSATSVPPSAVFHVNHSSPPRLYGRYASSGRRMWSKSCPVPAKDRHTSKHAHDATARRSSVTFGPVMPSQDASSVLHPMSIARKSNHHNIIMKNLIHLTTMTDREFGRSAGRQPALGSLSRRKIWTHD